MDILTSNDYKILQNIVDMEGKRGLTKGRGTTKKRIAERTGLSLTKIQNTTKILLELGLIGNAVRQGHANAFYVTKKGYKRLAELKQNILMKESE